MVRSLYCASLYFTVYTITSVGYGDIGPQNILERIICTFMVMSAGVSWACVLGQVCGIIGTMGKHEQEFSEIMDELNYVCLERRLPTQMVRRIRGFFLSTKGAQRQLKQQELLRRS